MTCNAKRTDQRAKYAENDEDWELSRGTIFCKSNVYEVPLYPVASMVMLESFRAHVSN